MKRPLSIKEIIKTGILKFFRHFSKINRRKKRYKTDKIGEKVELWPTPIFMLKIEEEKG